VASIPKRIQVYFIDNDEYFKRKTFADEEGVMYPDNDERIFLCKGVVETVKKLNWVQILFMFMAGWLLCYPYT
jgi:starch synthase